MNIAPGTIWKHYKGRKYEILHVAMVECSGAMHHDVIKERDLVVVYREWPATPLEMVFARSLFEWLQYVPAAPDGAKVAPKTPRFEPYARDAAHAESRGRTS